MRNSKHIENKKSIIDIERMLYYELLKRFDNKNDYKY